MKMPCMRNLGHFLFVISMHGRLPVSVSVRLPVLIPKDMPAQKKYQRAEMMLKATPEFFQANMRQRNRVAKAVKCEVFANMDIIQRVIEKDCQLTSIEFLFLFEYFISLGQLVNPLSFVPVWVQLRIVRKGPVPTRAWLLCSGQTLVS